MEEISMTFEEILPELKKGAKIIGATDKVP